MKILQLEKGSASADILNLLNQNIIGTPGKSLVYQHQKAAEKLQFIKEAYFPCVKLGGKTIGAACFIPRQIQLSQQKISAIYIRYFSIRQSFRSTSEPIARIQKSGVLKAEIQELFEENLLELPNRHIYYAYVDPENIRSKRLIEDFGFSQVGIFRTVFFSRFSPKLNPNIKSVTATAIGDFVDQFYQNHSFFFKDYLGYQNGLLAYYHEGRLVAILQANAEHWKVYEIPGSKKRITWISKIPFINRLFNADFKFVSLEAVSFLPGFEWTLPHLITHALAMHQRNTAVICLDPKSSLYSVFQGMNRGFIKILTNEKEMAVVARGSHFDLATLASAPVYVSGFDNM